MANSMNVANVEDGLWAAVVAAEERLAAAKAAFYRMSASRSAVLATALTGSSWERSAALSFLRSLPEDVPNLVPELFALAVSPAWSSSARDAMGSISQRRDP
jgi:hypothetical protein